jgi:hypothetical protein
VTEVLPAWLAQAAHQDLQPAALLEFRRCIPTTVSSGSLEWVQFRVWFIPDALAHAFVAESEY